MNSRFKFITFFIVFALLLSCKTKEKAKKRDLEGKKTEYLLQQLSINEFDFDYFSGKAAVKIFNDGKKTPFKANIRIRKDSAIWISVTPAFGIEVARVLVTQDTVKVLNRLERNYFIGDYEYINKRFNVELDFELMQSILIGNAIDFEPDEKIKLRIDKEKYYLGNLKKRKAKKADDKPQKIERQKEEVVSLWIDQTNFKITNFLFSDLTANRFITGEYNNFQTVGEQLLPHDLRFEFQSEKPAEVELEYSRVSLENSLKFSFNISSKYEQVYY